MRMLLFHCGNKQKSLARGAIRFVSRHVVRVGGAIRFVSRHVVRVGGAIRFVSRHVVRVGGACGPPPPFAAPLVPRCALSSGATPRDELNRRLRLGWTKAQRGRMARWQPHV
jgi:hypothetical protein